MRTASDKWVVAGQNLSDRLAAHLANLVQTAWFWVAVVILVPPGLALKYSRAVKLRLEIWRLRHGRGVVDQDVVEELFYRAARLAQRRVPGRRPAETWREWIFSLPDPNRRPILEKALAVFEKSKYGRVPVSSTDFAILQETIRELKL